MPLPRNLDIFADVAFFVEFVLTKRGLYKLTSVGSDRRGRFVRRRGRRNSQTRARHFVLGRLLNVVVPV